MKIISKGNYSSFGPNSYPILQSGWNRSGADSSSKHCHIPFIQFDTPPPTQEEIRYRLIIALVPLTKTGLLQKRSTPIFFHPFQKRYNNLAGGISTISWQDFKSQTQKDCLQSPGLHWCHWGRPTRITHTRGHNPQWLACLKPDDMRIHQNNNPTRIVSPHLHDQGSEPSNPSRIYYSFTRTAASLLVMGRSWQQRALGWKSAPFRPYGFQEYLRKPGQTQKARGYTKIPCRRTPNPLNCGWERGGREQNLSVQKQPKASQN